ncbi:hypothetical protein C2S53_013507 [Perilla frutescens var. hirtella]|uniref:Legume lectin domain-containing protein n=1 Tax=Perilla frutescens var. hirtella TaxID=608512 RepID=A0AAD4P724_PERFH|nr:hypothetical protein C2S53_013507 [Perilla frutescens var. hirtella]
MATSLQTLIPLLSSIALLLTLADTVLGKKSSTSFAFDFSGEKPTDLTYQGDAHFPTDTAILRLTRTDDFGNAQSLSIGRVVYSKPVTFSDKKKQANFQTTLKFIIKRNNGDEEPPADGLVFFIAPVNSAVAAPGGSFGVFDESGKNPSVFAVEFDIFVNDIFDPTYRHVGIDIQSQISSNVTEVGGDAMIGQEVTAVIGYDAATKLISVHGTAGGKSFEVSYVYDLSTLLPQLVEVGISAATGGDVAVHDVISWSFDSDVVHVK